MRKYFFWVNRKSDIRAPVGEKIRNVMFVTLLTGSLIPSYVNAQSNWVSYSPPDRSFSIELPKTPMHQRRKPKDTNVNLFDGYKFKDLYLIRSTSEGAESVFTIFVYEASDRKRKRRLSDEEVNSMIKIIGGDDKKFIRRMSTLVDGSPAWDFVYEKGIKSGRTLIIDAGGRVYMLLYYTYKGGEVMSESVSRIFRTFRLTR